jgi:hypothetical protein
MESEADRRAVTVLKTDGTERYGLRVHPLSANKGIKMTAHSNNLITAKDYLSKNVFDGIRYPSKEEAAYWAPFIVQALKRAKENANIQTSI